MPRTAIAQIRKMIGRELQSGVGRAKRRWLSGRYWRRLAPPRKSSGACSPRRTASARTIA
jgi:hypothetical protein